MPVQLLPLELSEQQIYKIKATIKARTVEDRVTKCWIWQGATNSGGYGVMGVPLEKKTRGAHALAYIAWKGFPGEGLVLDHEICDNPPCCNPDHLVPKPSWDNTRRSTTNPFAIKDTATHCIHGHEFTEENIYRHPQRGTRHCIQCSKDDTQLRVKGLWQKNMDSYELFGEKKRLKEWSRDTRCVVPYATLFRRVRKLGWKLEESMCLPSGYRKPKRDGLVSALNEIINGE